MKLTATNVCKTINGQTILKDINLDLDSGNIYAFVGTNGSGKTMLFRAISGLMKIDSGEININKQILHKDLQIPTSLGIVLENAGLYPEFTGYKNLKILSKLKNIIGDEEIFEAMEKVGLDPLDKRTYKKYSLGMKQRLVIAQAIMEKPDIVILDEPTNSLDENGVEDIRKIILAEKERGAMVLLSSHNNQDIELLADKIYRINKGEISDGEIK